jgi:hypothetical protein
MQLATTLKEQDIKNLKAAQLKMTGMLRSSSLLTQLSVEIQQN